MPHSRILQHLPHEGPGVFGDVLGAAGWTVTVHHTPLEGVPAADADLLLVLGGPCGAYEADIYPYLAPEIALLRTRIADGRPTLGVCLGSQLIAAAMGARVFPGPVPEIGWHRVELTPAGRASPLAALDQAPILHWHGDTFDLPQGAELLASTAAYAHQAFSRGPNLLALQCHPEADGREFEHWLIGQEAGLKRHGLSVSSLRAQAAAHGARAGEAGAAMFAAWLAGLAL